MSLPTELKQVVKAAYSGMTIGDDWTKAQQKDLIKDSEHLLERLMSQGENPRDSLERIFALWTPKNDPGRGAWFMSLAESKAQKLHVDLDEKQDAESLLKRLGGGAATMLGSNSSSDDKSEEENKPKAAPPNGGRIKSAVKSVFGPEHPNNEGNK